MSELNDLKETIGEALSDFQNGVSQIEDVIERYYSILGTTQCNELNEMISFGFVPNAKFIFDDKETFTFIGYTEGLGMQFRNKEGTITSCPLSGAFKNMAKFKRVEE